ncbi:hypothetical protein ACN9JT_08945, partial [Aliarcobacter butzleri]
LSVLSNFNLNDIFMMEVSAFSTIFFPFQSPPLIVGLTLANIKQIKVLKILFILSLISIFLLFPLQYYWLEFIKIFF